MITRDPRRPALQPLALRFTPRYLQARWRDEKGVWISKRRLRRQFGKLKEARRRG